jgi:hypothetical protein
MPRDTTIKIFLCGFFLITLVVFMIYVIKEKDHQQELTKIAYYENKMLKEKRELNLIRQKTDPCHVPNLNTPKTCYFNSDFQCSWNPEAKRCDKKQ